MDSLFEIEITFYCNLKKCLCLVRSYYLQTWHRISCMTNTLHSPAYFYLRSIKTEPIRDIPFWKKSISIRLLIVTNCSNWICVFFFFIIGFFFSRTEKKNYYWFWFYCGYWISWNQFRIKSRKYWYSVQRSFENFVLFYLLFPAQFFVDVKKSCFIKKENIIERGRPWLSRPEAKSPVA